MTKDQEIAVGTRVRLHSGAERGTILGWFEESQRVLVRWDSGQRATWHLDALMILPKPSAEDVADAMLTARCATHPESFDRDCADCQSSRAYNDRIFTEQKAPRCPKCGMRQHAPDRWCNAA